MFLTINVFFDNFGSRRTWKLGRRDITEGHKSIDNSGVNLKCLRTYEFSIVGYNPNVLLV